ncbi:MAG: hypothetical protein WBI41_05905 [Azovibrio sp.]|uniref:hypothetical protein n=1 Tax=Azovibrio sp. TaxID=1872673 RepID=UPI003C77B29D
MDTYEQLIAAGAENIHPVFTGDVVDKKGNKKRVVVANAVDGTIYLTDEGREFLKQADNKPSGATKAKLPRKNYKAETEPEPEVAITDKETDELTDV